MEVSLWCQPQEIWYKLCQSSITRRSKPLRRRKCTLRRSERDAATNQSLSRKFRSQKVVRLVQYNHCSSSSFLFRWECDNLSSSHPKADLTVVLHVRASAFHGSRRMQDRTKPIRSFCTRVWWMDVRIDSFPRYVFLLLCWQWKWFWVASSNYLAEERRGQPQCGISYWIH